MDVPGNCWKYPFRNATIPFIIGLADVPLTHRFGRREDRVDSVVLNYSRTHVRRPSAARWVRALWSHRVRVELAQTASFGQALGIVACISLISATLSVTHHCLAALMVHVRGPAAGSLDVLLQKASNNWFPAVQTAFTYAPIYFLALVAVLVLLSLVSVRLSSHGQSWAKTFPVMSVGAVPLVWFFVLFQFEGFAPYTAPADAWLHWWNPVTNIVRFVILMAAIALLAVWVLDAGRLYQSMRDRHIAGH